MTKVRYAGLLGGLGAQTEARTPGYRSFVIRPTHPQPTPNGGLAPQRNAPDPTQTGSMSRSRPLLATVLVAGIALTGCSAAIDLVSSLRSTSRGSASGPVSEKPFERPAADGVRLEPTKKGKLTGRTIVLDPGHAGVSDPAISGHVIDMPIVGRRPCYTSGTTAVDGTPEHTLNHVIARKLASQLRARGATVVLTRGDDESLGPCNDDRARLANRVQADLLVSIHGDGDAEDKRGFHIIHAASMVGGPALEERSRKAALTIARSLRKRSPLPPANYKGTPDAPIDPRDNLGALALLENTPGVLVELGNLKNAKDVALLTGDKNRDAVAAALADGVQRVVIG